MNILVSIIIPTYNRSEILNECLGQIENSLRETDVEVIVIDNNSNDNTMEICQKFDFCTRVLEIKQGLSYARNRGAREATGDWIFYIDDDMYLHPHSLDHLIRRVKTISDNVAIIGGSYDGCFLNPRPIWLGDNFVSFKPFNEVTPLTNGFVHGGIFCVKKLVFQEIGGFDTSLGMVGAKMGYGEEEEFQNRARKAGFEICFDPNVSGSHLVGEHKYDWRWYVTSGYQLTKSNILSGRHDDENAIWFLIKSFLLIGYNIVFFIKKNYKRFSFSHFTVFILRECSTYLGFVRGFLKKYSSK